MAFFQQLRLLLWKNFTLKRRHKIALVAEIIWPLVLFLILALVRTKDGLKTRSPQCHFEGKPLPSAGPLPFLQGFVCTFNNTCYTELTTDEQPGVFDNFNTSLITRLLNDVETIVGDPTQRVVLYNLARDARVLRTLAQKGLLNDTVQLKQLLSDPAAIKAAVRRQNISISQDSLDKLLNSRLITDHWLNPTAHPEFQMLGNETFLNSLPNNESIINILRSGNPGQILDHPSVVEVSDKLRSGVCNGTLLTYFLRFDNANDADQVKQEVCQLNRTQFTLLDEDFMSQYSQGKFLNVISNAIEQHTGSRLSLNASLDSRLGDFFNTVSKMESINMLTTDLNETYADFMELQSTHSQKQRIQDLSKLFCGRPDTFLAFSLGRSDWTKMIDNFESSGQSTGRDDSNVHEDDDDKDATPFCRDLFLNLTSRPSTKILWRQMKPVIRGFIPYAPNTAVTRKIIQEANKTFETIELFIKMTEDWDKVAPSMKQFFLNASEVDQLRTFAESPQCSLLMSARMVTTAGTRIDICQRLQQFLGKRNSNLANYMHWESMVDRISTIFDSARMYLQCFRANKFVAFDSEDDLVKHSLKLIESNSFWAAIVFDEASSVPVTDNVTSDTNILPSLIKYKIRMDAFKVDSTKKIMDKYWSPSPRRRPSIDLKYLTFGFAYLQDMVDHAIISLQTGWEENTGIVVQQFPYPCYISDSFIIVISRSLPLFMVLSWTLTVALLVKGIVYEKETRLKEVMKMMGLGNGVHWVSWFITSLIVLFVTVLLFLIILKVGNVLMYSNPAVILLFMMSFLASTVGLCFMISVFFSRANLAAVCAGFIYFLSYLPYTQLVQWEERLTLSQKMASCLFSNVAFGFACSEIATFEEQAVGMQWSNIAESRLAGDSFSMAHCIVMMWVDFVLYLLITWYIETVFPGMYGIPRPWYFFVQKSYWLGVFGKKHDVEPSGQRRHTLNHSLSVLSRENPENFESDPTGYPLGVAVRDLRKVYSNGKVAVDGLSMNFYEGQITSFLGHNGAGKTTTMSIITGLFPPTEGTAYIYNRDVCTEMDEIRSSLGMCPQFNVLFDLLTVKEHLWFYARLKGLAESEVKSEVDQMIDDVGLQDKRKELSKNLSGGMKRKLSVAIAFTGGSQTVILDEPTAGIDPYARRSIWELLLKYKKDHTIILSTHHMDEADVLGDRIAIISYGRLKCCGSSLFLKNRFGSGYYLTMVRSEERNQDDLDNSFEDSYRKYAASEVSDSDVKAEVANQFNSLATGDFKQSTDAKIEDEGFAGSIKSDDRSDTSSSTLPIHGSTMITGFSETRLSAFIEKYIPNAKLKEYFGTELNYQLPEDGAQSSNLEQLFQALEMHHTDLGISSYGISDTSLEEVFLRIADDNLGEMKDDTTEERLDEDTEGGRLPRPVTRLSFRSKTKRFLRRVNPRSHSRRVVEQVNLTERVDFDEGSQAHKRGTQSNSHNPVTRRDTAATGFTNNCMSDISPTTTTNRPAHGAIDTQSTTSFADDDALDSNRIKKQVGWSLIGRQFLALFIKRFHHMRRSKKGFISEIILPAGFVCIAMIFQLIVPPVLDEPSLELQPWMYSPKKGDPHLYMFYSNDALNSSMSDKYVDTLLSKSGLGNRCLNPSIYTIDGYSCSETADEERSKWTNNPEHVDTSKPCSCDTGWQVCPAGAEGSEPSQTRLDTTDHLYNMTNRNISDWLVKTMKKYIKHRYGGFSFGITNPTVTANKSDIQEFFHKLTSAANNGTPLIFGNESFWDDFASMMALASVKNLAKVWFNNKGWAAMVSYTNAINNLLMRTHLPEGKKPEDYGIVTYNHPMNFTQDQFGEEAEYKSFKDLMVAICVIFAMSFIPASFVLFLIDERVTGAKHLIFVSGINPVIYWVANYIWDIMNYLVPGILCMLIFVTFGAEAYVSAINAPCLMALLFLYGWSITPMMYPFSKFFNTPSYAFVVLSGVNVILGFVSTLSTFILEMLEQNNEDLGDINDVLRKVFLVLPHYCLGRGMMDMAKVHAIQQRMKVLGIDYPYNPFDWDNVGRNLFSMAVCAVVSFALTLLIEHGFFFRSRNTKVPEILTDNENEDEDVVKERERVTNNSTTDILRLEHLYKVYNSRGKKGKFTAVNNLSFGVPKGQCFGLLGVNGAGKTTTFKMLTGDTSITKGNAYICNYSTRSDLVKARQNLGYCPQFDALDSLLTGREHLEFYARVRGVTAKDIKTVVDWGVRKLDLKQYEKRLAGGYSGGNKRKLSTAIALMGDPQLIFLDEPTSGMDPKARRFLWNSINSIVKDGRSVILTSHSMEECEALCSRLAIMVNGSFRCIGSIQHLKNKFGNGYMLTLRVSGSTASTTEPVRAFMAEQFPEAKLLEQHNNMLQYQLGIQGDALSRVFRAMEKGKAELGIEDYSVSQTTLDQVFINFAKRQGNEGDSEEEEDLTQIQATRGENDTRQTAYVV